MACQPRSVLRCITLNFTSPTDAACEDSRTLQKPSRAAEAVLVTPGPQCSSQVGCEMGPRTGCLLARAAVVGETERAREKEREREKKKARAKERAREQESEKARERESEGASERARGERERERKKKKATRDPEREGGRKSDERSRKGGREKK